MAKNLDPKCKQCRREGEKLFLKGERCYSSKCSMVRRNYPPGVHGPASKGGPSRASEYQIQLREKQKAKRIYGLREKQFKNYFIEASKKKEGTGEIFLQLLERRLDNVVFRLGLAKSRDQARQLVSHGFILVNGRKVDIPSYRVKSKDIIEVKDKVKKKSHFINFQKSATLEDVPKWLKIDPKSLKGEVVSLPTLEDLPQNINPQLIVEFYSK